MKKITIFMCVILMALALNAQEKKMFTHLKNGEVLATPISQIDSVTFGTGGDNEPGVWINGIYWAKCNVNKPGFFTAKPEDFGMFYQWGSKVGWSSTDPLEASDGIHSWRILAETGDIWKPENDPCPTGWRVPTESEMDNLRKVGGSAAKLNEVPGYYFGTGSQKVFLPSAESRYFADGDLEETPGHRGNYWSSTSESYYQAANMFFHFSGSSPGIAWSNHGRGFSIRCVKE